MKYAMINDNEVFFKVQLMCEALEVSRSGYYDWRNREESNRDKENKILALEIKAIFEREKQRPGSPRITKRLQAVGLNVGKNRVAKIMREHGWRAKGSKKFKATTNSNHNLPVAPNLLQQNFEATHPNHK